MKKGDTLKYTLENSFLKYFSFTVFVFAVLIFSLSNVFAAIAVDDYANTTTRRMVIIDVLANDLDVEKGAEAFVNESDEPSNGSLFYLGEGKFRYLPDPGFSGIDSFVYNGGLGENFVSFTHPDGTTHYYEMVRVSDEISWRDAKEAAEQRTFRNLTGYLVTVTSQEE